VRATPPNRGHAHHQDDLAGHIRWQQCAQAVDDLRQQGLERAGEKRHAELQRQAADPRCE
jgi:hypothetical protein